MSQQKGSTLGGFIVLAVVAFLGYQGFQFGVNQYKKHSVNPDAPETVISKPLHKYEVGDCFASKNSAEVERWQFKTTYSHSYRVEEVGKREYRLQYWFGTISNDTLASAAYQTSRSIRYTDEEESFQKVDCTELVQVHAREKEAYEAWYHANKGR